MRYALCSMSVIRRRPTTRNFHVKIDSQQNPKKHDFLWPARPSVLPEQVHRHNMTVICSTQRCCHLGKKHRGFTPVTVIEKRLMIAVVVARHGGRVGSPWKMNNRIDAKTWGDHTIGVCADKVRCNVSSAVMMTWRLARQASRVTPRLPQVFALPYSSRGAAVQE